MFVSQNIPSKVTPAGAELSRMNRVLIVEDDLCLKTILLSVLKKVDSETQCVWVTNADDARTALRKEKFDLIVADYHLGSTGTGMDLWQDCQAKGLRVPFLLMSGVGVEKFLHMTSDMRQAPLYLPKPFRASECFYYFNTLLKGGFHV